MHKMLKEAKEVLNNLEDTLEKAKLIWNQIDADNSLISDTNHDEWKKKKARCWLHGGTDLIETNELEKWLFDSPPLSDISQESAAECVRCWREWLELREAYYEPFSDFAFEKPDDEEILLQFIIRLAHLFEKEGKGARLEWRALKSFLSYLRQMPQQQIAFIEQIFPHDFYLKEQSLDRFGLSSGRWATASLCPFHEDRSAGSFKVNKDSGAYTCFSCGAKGGDIIDFLQKKHRLSFIEAVDKLKDEWRIV